MKTSIRIENTIPEKFQRKGSLVRRKVREYVPSLIVTNLSLLLINTVDKVVAGNLIGPDAMNSISIFYPVLLITGAFSALVASGIATSLSNAMGSNDPAAIAHIRSAGVRIMIISAIAAGIIQIPIVWAVIKSYNVSDELSSMVWQYAIGCMICTPISIVSSVGTQDLQITGKVKIIMKLTILEGGCNLALDLLFVAVFNMGVAGTGYGTACSNLIRCACTVFYLYKYSDFFKSDGQPVTINDARSILSRGVPDACFCLMMAFQNYCALQIILHSFGDDGGVIYGVCTFCLNIVNVLLSGIKGGVQPLMGLYTGSGDKMGMRDLMRYGILLVFGYAGFATALIMLFPELFYHLNGVDQIPDGGVLSLQLYAVYFVLLGIDCLLRLFLTNRKDIKFTTTLIIAGNATLPVFALAIAAMSVPAPYIFLSYTATELLVFILSAYRFQHWRSADLKEDMEGLVLYMTVLPEDAVEASQYVRKVAEENNIDKRVSYRVALCFEEMAAYIKESDHMDSWQENIEKFVAFVNSSDRTASLPPELKEIVDIIDKNKSVSQAYAELSKAIAEAQSSDWYALLDLEPINVDIILRFNGTTRATLTVLDDGSFIHLDWDEEKIQLLLDNYNLIKKIASDVEYQYLLNMNYTRLQFDAQPVSK